MNTLDTTAVAARARQLLDDKTSVIIDTETNGLFGEVIQIGMIDLDGNVLMNQLIRATRTLDPDSARIHGITAAELHSAPRFREIANQFLAHTAGRTLLAYNADYDAAVLAVHLVECGHQPPSSRQWDCILAGRTVVAGYRPCLRGPHQALGDCHAALDVLTALAAWPTTSAIAS